MQRLAKTLAPLFIAGIAIFAFAFGLMLFAYLFFFGALVGFILFIISSVKTKLFPPKTPRKPAIKSGRIIDSDDWKKL
jgi:hypothetical protein